MSLFFLGKHFSQGLYGRARTKNKAPATITRAPAQPTHVTDQDNSWCRGMDWSLAKNESTDWWKTMRQRKIKTPVERQRGKKEYHQMYTNLCCLAFISNVELRELSFLNDPAAFVLEYIVWLVLLLKNKLINK